MAAVTRGKERGWSKTYQGLKALFSISVFALATRSGSFHSNHSFPQLQHRGREREVVERWISVVLWC